MSPSITSPTPSRPSSGHPGVANPPTLRALNRIYEEVPGARAEGVINYKGKNILSPSVDPVALRRHIGMVFQRPNPFPGLSIYENTIIGLRLAGKRNKSILMQACEASLKKAALWDEVKDKLGRSALGLSGGQQQRLCIARSIAINPLILLMDGTDFGPGPHRHRQNRRIDG